jgi:hypothetical protein
MVGGQQGVQFSALAQDVRQANMPQHVHMQAHMQAQKLQQQHDRMLALGSSSQNGHPPPMTEEHCRDLVFQHVAWLQQRMQDAPGAQYASSAPTGAEAAAENDAAVAAAVAAAAAELAGGGAANEAVKEGAAAGNAAAGAGDGTSSIAGGVAGASAGADAGDAPQSQSDALREVNISTY